MFSSAISNRNSFVHKFSSKKSLHLILISILSLLGSGLFALLLRFIGGLIQGRFVGPEILGYYVKFTILPSYLAFLELGVFISLARQYPYHMGTGDHDLAILYAKNALGWSYFICILLSFIFFVPLLWSMFQSNWMNALGWGTQLIIVPSAFYQSYLD